MKEGERERERADFESGARLSGENARLLRKRQGGHLCAAVGGGASRTLQLTNNTRNFPTQATTRTNDEPSESIQDQSNKNPITNGDGIEAPPFFVDVQLGTCKSTPEAERVLLIRIYHSTSKITLLHSTLLSVTTNTRTSRIYE